MSTDIDHGIIAGAFESVGDFERANYHWGKCVQKSPALALKAYNLRGHARFLFSQGKPEAARQKYDESLSVANIDSDRTRRDKADTLMFWALAERDYGFLEEGARRRDQALAEAKRIGNSASRAEMLAYLEQVWSGDPSTQQLKTTAAASNGGIVPAKEIL